MLLQLLCSINNYNMADRNLTGQLLSNVYSTFLHLTGTVSDTNYQSVYDGLGNITTLKLTTTGASVDNFIVNKSAFTFAKSPPVSTGVNMLVYSTATSAVESRTINSILSTTNSLTDGNYSSPTITVSGGIIRSLYSNDVSRFIRATATTLLSSESVPSTGTYAVSALAYFRSVSASDTSPTPALGESVFYVHTFSSILPFTTDNILIQRQTYYVKWTYISGWGITPVITPV